MFKKSHLLKQFLLLAGLILYSLVGGRADAAGKPNIVILLCDDLGYGDLGCFAHPAISYAKPRQAGARGPQADALLLGVAGLFAVAGRPDDRPHPNRLGIRDWIPAKQRHLPAAAGSDDRPAPQKAGYRTCHAGKWHLNSKTNGSEPTPGDAGFDHWLYTQNNAAPSHLNPTNFVRNGKRSASSKARRRTLSSPRRSNS